MARTTYCRLCRVPIMEPRMRCDACRANRGRMVTTPTTVTLREFTERERADCAKLACTIRNGLLKAMADAGLVREPQYDGESDYTEEFSVASCEIAERLMRLMRRAGVKDGVSEEQIAGHLGGVDQ